MCEGDLVKICALWVVQMCMCERCQTNFLFMSGVANKQTNNLKHRNGGSVISVQYLLKGVWFFFPSQNHITIRHYIGAWGGRWLLRGGGCIMEFDDPVRI